MAEIVVCAALCVVVHAHTMMRLQISDDETESELEELAEEVFSCFRVFLMFFGRFVVFSFSHSFSRCFLFLFVFSNAVAYCGRRGRRRGSEKAARSQANRPFHRSARRRLASACVDGVCGFNNSKRSAKMRNCHAARRKWREI